MAIFLKSLITIYSSDINKASYFYGRILGLEESYRFPTDSSTPEHIEFNVGGTTIAVSSEAGLRSHGMPPPTPGHPFEIGFKTTDLKSVIEELRTAGVVIIKEPAVSSAGNLYAYISDTDGNWLSLYQNLKN